MKRMAVVFLFVLSFFGVCFGQGYEDFGYVDEKMLQEREQFLVGIKNYSPDLYKYEKELFGIQRKIQRILRGLKEQSISKKTAKKELEPLLERQREIMNSLDYQVEKVLLNASSEYLRGALDDNSRYSF